MADFSGKITRIKLNSKGVRALLKSEEMQNGLKEIAAGAAERCGSGYGSDMKMMGTRVIASVYTETEEAAEDNYEHNTILTRL